MSSTLQAIASALPSVGRAKLLINSNDDVVICAAVRTALTKVSTTWTTTLTRLGPNFSTTYQAKKGGFKDTCPEDLLAAVLKEAYTRAKLDPSKIE
jgi:acetyl-CoA acyltransferase 1